jgi:hypothetical protein
VSDANVGKDGRARKLRDARLTAAERYPVGAVVCVHAKAMKEPWCLAASDAEAPTAMLVTYPGTAGSGTGDRVRAG